MKTKIWQKEFIWVIFSIVILYFLTYVPVLRNFAIAPSERYYWGSIEYAIDQIGNLTNIREGYLGHWLRFPKVTSTIEGKPSLVKFESIFIGQLARVSRIDPLIMYHLTRIVLSLTTLLFIYWLIKNIYTRKTERIVSYIFVLFATSITLPFTWSRKIVFDLPFDIYVFFRLTNSSHHYLLGILFTLVSLYFLSKVIDDNRRIGYFILAAASGMFTGLVYSPSVILIILSLPFFWFIFLFRKYIDRDTETTLVCSSINPSNPLCCPFGLQTGVRWVDKAAVGSRKVIAVSIYILIYIVIAVIPIIYYRYISQSWEFNLLTKIEKIVPFDPLPWQYGYLVGFTYFLAVFAIPYVFKKGKTILLMLIPWVVVHPLAVYVLAPLVEINKTRFFMTAYFVVFAILAVSGVIYLGEILGRLYKKTKFIQIITFIMIPIVVIVSGILTYQRNNDVLNICFCLPWNFSFAYPKKEVMEAVNWLRDNTKEDEIVLSGFYAGMLIPAFSGNQVYTSWWHRLLEPPNLEKTYQDSIRFYSGAISSEEALKFLESQKIVYIYWGDQEREELGGGKELRYPFLKEKIRRNNTVIYAINNIDE